MFLCNVQAIDDLALVSEKGVSILLTFFDTSCHGLARHLTYGTYNYCHAIFDISRVGRLRDAAHLPGQSR
jgi:hypothetical protein